MAHLSTIPTKAAVERAWLRYSSLHAAVNADPLTREDPMAKIALERAHDRFCQVYADWSGR